MDLLFELSYIVSKKPPKSLDLLLPRSSKSRKLYDAVIKKKVLSDKEAAEFIYKSSHRDKKYLMLKRHVINKLSELVLIVEYFDINRNNYANIKFRCEKELIIAEKLLLQNVYHNAEKIISKVFQIAKKNSLIEVIHNCASKFRFMYALKGSYEKVKFWDVEIKKYREFLSYENDSFGFWHIIQSKIKFTFSKTKSLVEELKSYIKKVEEWLKKYESPFIELDLCRLQRTKAWQENNYKNMKYWEDRIVNLSKKFDFLVNKQFIVEINIERAKYYRAIRDLDKAEFYIKKAIEITDYQAFDKFEVQTWAFDLKIKQGKYIEAAEIFKEVKNVSQYKYLDETDLAVWNIREAYLHLCFLMENMQSEIEKYTPRFAQNFSKNNFLSRCMLASRDKQGYNIMFLIIKLLLQLYYKKKIIDREGNNLNMYYHRNLKELNGQRTRFFFRRMAKTAIAGFFTEEINKQEEKFNNRIAEHKVENYYDNCEIIPYDKLWEFIHKMA